MTAPSAETGYLVRRAIEGDQEATGKLLERYRPKLKRMVSIRLDNRLRGRLDPSDIVQSVLAEAARKIMVDLNNQPDNFYPWLRQMAWDQLARVHRDHVHVKKRSVMREERVHELPVADESMLQLAEQLAARQLGPHSHAVREEARARVQAALAQLSPEDREVLVLRFLEQLDIADTASALDVTVSAVKSRQFRAIQRLGLLLNDFQ